jgi:hypothetical protein
LRFQCYQSIGNMSSFHCSRDLVRIAIVYRLRGAVPTSEAQTFRCTTAGAVAAGRRRVRRLLLGVAALMLGLAIVVLVAGRWGPALICAGAAFLCVFAWRMSGDLDPFWLTLTGDQLTVQMRRQRASLALRNVEARRLTAAESAHLASLTSADGVTFASASYESRLLGTFDLHATDLEHAVLVETDAPPEEPGGPRSHHPVEPIDRVRWIVTPDEPEVLLRALGTLGAGTSPAPRSADLPH